MRDRVSITAIVGLVAIALLVWARAPAPPKAEPLPIAAPKRAPTHRHADVPPSVSPERLLQITLQTQATVANWIGAAVVMCRVPGVPEPNRALIDYDGVLPGGFVERATPDHHGDVFSFYVPRGPGRARLIVEAVGTWEVSWPDVVVGEIEPCSAITPRAETSTIHGTVHTRGACKELIVRGCGTQSDVDRDGSFVLLDVEPGACDLQVSNGHDWSSGPPPCSAPAAIEVTVGESMEVDLAIDCDASLAACPDTWNRCGTVTLMMETMAPIKEQLATPGLGDLTPITAQLPPILRGTRELCAAAAPAIDRIASDLGADLTTGDGSPDTP